MVPSGASTGAYEAVEKRDGDPKRYNGRAYSRRSRPSTKLGPAIEGSMRPRSAKSTTRCSSSTARKTRQSRRERTARRVARRCTRGGDVARRAALPLSRGTVGGTLPVPMMNVINGGKHAEGALQFQEIMIVPYGATTSPRPCATARKFRGARQDAARHGQPTLVGDEGGYAPRARDDRRSAQAARESDRRGGLQAR